MSTISGALTTAFPKSQPDHDGARLLLFGIRQMGAHGLNDAAAANAFLMAFGKDFRRPLVLLRALMAEMASASSAPIQIAPWCCPRMTAAEATLLHVLGRTRTDTSRARLLLSDLLGVRRCDTAFAIAHTLATAFADVGLPLD